MKHLVHTALLLMLLYPILSPAQTQEATFAVPTLIQTADLSTESAIAPLMKSPALWQQLAELHQTLDQQTSNEQPRLFDQLALLSFAGQHEAVLAAYQQAKRAEDFYPYVLYSQAAAKHPPQSDGWPNAIQQQIEAVLRQADDETFVQLSQYLGWSVPRAEQYLRNVWQQVQSQQRVNRQQALAILSNAQLLEVLYQVIPLSQQQIKQEQSRRFEIQPRVMIKDGDIELTATIVRPKSAQKPRPTALQFTIYADEKAHILTAMHAAAHGYVGVVANSRGKRGSKNPIVPWEHEGEDAVRVINWVARQPFSDGRVAMYGGSYNGFTQWAAAKHVPEALKTIVPYAAASLITGLPLENNIVLTSNYEWAWHVTNNDTMDHSVYQGWQASENFKQKFYQSGLAIRDIEQTDGKPNPWFQKWLQHPGFDTYYQAMQPYKSDYARINIPVLSITGYFDGGQISALDYLQQHELFNHNSQHYLLIGPYTHGTAQGRPYEFFSNYQLDPVALEKDTEELTFAWFDHVLAGAPMPALLKDKINYQLMGANSWVSVPSFTALNQQGQNFYLRQEQTSGALILATTPAETQQSFTISVDMADRSEQRNLRHYPQILSELPDEKGLVFTTDAFEQPMQFAGSVTGYFSLALNKRDVDIGYNLYELTAEGEYFHLINYISRASYAADMATRTLLIPGQKARIPMTNTRMSARLLGKGSKLVMVLNVNKNADAQVNLGSGKPVADESAADAGEPLKISWFSDSLIHLPLIPWVAPE
ncbi:CocE/NonD family hydrolase [Bowmanella sp. JS7-9]|uniref:CocE/NonD family hydrolase n=1 Tax=Pseudobowmanella zhangzhouensis TaxID=1537679 RepID=A0ABW1XN52_9ALTE|nr:CocE/NonD family hydrolase [Bowmanella sp. JS7-9]